MKRKLWMCVCICLIMAGIGIWNPKVSYVYANQVGTVVTEGSGLNMRSGIGTANAVVTSIPNGSQVTILDQAAGSDNNGTWYKIQYNGQEGYVAAKYIAFDAQASGNPTQSTTKPEAVATPQPTMAPQPTQPPVPSVIYRTETTYKKISVKATLKRTVTVYRNTSQKPLKVKKKAVQLKKKKTVTILGEKTKGKTKWFRVQFKYKKKNRKGYIKNTDLKFTMKKKPAGTVTNVKTALRVRKKPGSSNPYFTINGRVVVLAKKQYVTITKVRTVKKKPWYRISFQYYGKEYAGYVQAKYIKLAKTRNHKKVPVVALSEKDFEEQLTKQGFPESYKVFLRQLHSQYPYWQFAAFHTGLDWNAAVTGESKLGLNLISNAKSEAWKSKEEGAYDAATGKWTVFDGSTWVAASKEAIMYYMDPRNFLTTQGIYQFELLEYQPEYQTLQGIQQILKNTPFDGTAFTYTDDVSGTEKTMSYASAFEQAGKQADVSPYHLASRSKQEVVTGATTASSAVSGTTTQYPGIFNFYNIGAYSGKNPVLNGLKWASKEDGTFMRPWNNRYRAIVGGGIYIGSNYINRGQNTGYLQKFNVTANSTYSHQYMTNVEAANSEALKTKYAYNGMLDSVPLVFSIPVYTNMPETNCPAPQ